MSTGHLPVLQQAYATLTLMTIGLDKCIGKYADFLVLLLARAIAQQAMLAESTTALEISNQVLTD